MKRLSITLTVVSIFIALGLPAKAEPPMLPNPEKYLAPYPNPTWTDGSLDREPVYQLDDGLYVYQERGTRAFFLITEDGVITVDPVNPGYAKNLRDAIASVTDKPVTHVIYSHNHWDHILGGKIFKDEGATFLAHEKCSERFAKQPNPDLVWPDITFGGNYTLISGGERVELLYFGSNHSDCLIFMRLKGGKYLYLVDIVTPGSMPLSMMPDTEMKGTLQTLAELEKLEIDAIISSHRSVLAHPSVVTERRLYLEGLQEAIATVGLDGALTDPWYDKVMAEMADFSYLSGFDRNIRENISYMVMYMGLGQ